MLNKTDVTNKIASLKAYSVSQNTTTEPLFMPLEAAVSTYFSSTVNIDKEVTDIIKYIYNDIWRRNTTYTNTYPLNLPTNYPKGYNDVRDCFYQFSELLSIDNATFYSAFVFSTEGTGTAAVETATSNSKLDSWTTEILAARATEKATLKALAEWCKNSEGSSDLVSLLEERGTITSELQMRQIAEIIYKDKGVLEIINTLNLNVYIPSYY